MSTLPGLTDQVVLHDCTGRGFASRVENAEGGLLTVAQPMDPESFEIGSELELSWMSARGVGSVPVAVLAAYADGPVAMWDVELLADPSFVQRREHVRIHHRAPMRIEVPGRPGGAGAIVGELIDVGEAALRCLVHDPQDDAQLVDGLQLETRFPLGETQFERSGWIHHRRECPDLGAEEPAAIIVMFDQSADEADALRREIFAQQLLQRRAARG
jgi:hypothetical protein